MTAPGGRIKCPVEGCTEGPFNTILDLQKHIKKKHRWFWQKKK